MPAIAFNPRDLHSIHSIISDWSNDAIASMSDHSISAKLCVPLKCIVPRIMGIFVGTCWVFACSIVIVPSFINMTIKQIIDYQGSVVGLFVQIAKVQALFFRLIAIEVGYFLGDILVPELMYGYFQLEQKHLEFQLDFLVQKITPLPGVFHKVSKQNDSFGEITAFAKTLDIQDSVWRKELFETLLANQKNRHEYYARDILHTSSTIFKECYLNVVTGQVIDKLQEKVKTNTFLNVVQSLTVRGLKVLYRHMPLELLHAVFEVRLDLESDLDGMKINPGDEFFYRSTITRKFSEILFEYMKRTQTDLLSRNIILSSDVVTSDERTITTIGCVALMNMLDNGVVLENGSLQLTSLDEPCTVILSHPKQIYGNKDTLLEIHNQLQELAPEEKEELFMKFCDQTTESFSRNVEGLFRKIMEFKNITFDGILTATEDYNPSELVPWDELHTIDI